MAPGKRMVMGEERLRVPPGQRVVSKFPVLHVGPVPKFDPTSAKWVGKLRFTGEQELGYWEKRVSHRTSYLNFLDR